MQPKAEIDEAGDDREQRFEEFLLLFVGAVPIVEMGGIAIPVDGQRRRGSGLNGLFRGWAGLARSFRWFLWGCGLHINSLSYALSLSFSGANKKRTS
ncbi:hypothetical protein B7H23_03385 [Notoacmeibacter marinus]|uniref:Uncharacterized protein n=1 Tax=Notoacmeibacter marinus TaxID=1876515 RepID=A0A231V1E2_9HYPH|nr:hypothetical protein B7H23_03385 [Notoacmeibacter marinus]